MKFGLQKLQPLYIIIMYRYSNPNSIGWGSPTELATQNLEKVPVFAQ